MRSSTLLESWDPIVEFQDNDHEGVWSGGMPAVASKMEVRVSPREVMEDTTASPARSSDALQPTPLAFMAAAQIPSYLAGRPG